MSCKEGILPVTEPKVYCMKGVVLYSTEITYWNILYLNQHSAYSDTYCNTLYCLQHSLLSKQYQLSVLFWRYILSRVDICEGQGLVYMWRPTWGFAS